jgi:hypothetical protein
MDVERELQYVLAWRIHSCFVEKVIGTITQDTPLRPSSTTFDHNSGQSVEQARSFSARGVEILP